jgi:outer membrane immunogenic protein
LAFVALIALSAPGFAADRPVKAPVYKAPPPAVVYGWTGFYVGANIGYSWGRAGSDWNIFAPFVLGGPCTAPPASGALCSAGSGSNRLNGAIGGLQAGYNWQNGNFLAGLETDIQWSGQKGNGLFTSTFQTAAAGVNGVVAIDQSVKLQWLGTLRGRTGITFDRWLAYGTGGLAYGAVKVEAAASATGSPSGVGLLPDCLAGCPFIPFASWSNTRTKVGWVAGAGIEGALDDGWTVKLEYLHVDLGTVETAFATLPGLYGNFIPALGGATSFSVAGTGTIRTRVTDEIVRVGLNYRFGGPIVARN